MMIGGMRGTHMGMVLNEARRELLSFLSINEATVCNTWFPELLTNRLGNIPSLNSGTASIMSS